MPMRHSIWQRLLHDANHGLVFFAEARCVVR